MKELQGVLEDMGAPLRKSYKSKKGLITVRAPVWGKQVGDKGMCAGALRCICQEAG